MARVQFRKGEQRAFLKKVLESVNCPSLRAFEQFGFGINYSTLKNYFNESRNLPENLFLELCIFSKLNKGDFSFEILEDNFGQVKGGRLSKRKYY